jgi:hypothetical protein
MPVTGDVARAGDLGYTTGPWVRSERKPGGKPLAYGWYFTVWKRQVDGTWKVAADIGTTTPAHGLPGTDAFRPAGGAGDQGSSVPARAGKVDASDIMAAEKTFSDRAARAPEAHLAAGRTSGSTARRGACSGLRQSSPAGNAPTVHAHHDVLQSRPGAMEITAQGGPSAQR